MIKVVSYAESHVAQAAFALRQRIALLRVLVECHPDDMTYRDQLEAATQSLTILEDSPWH